MVARIGQKASHNYVTTEFPGRDEKCFGRRGDAIRNLFQLRYDYSASIFITFLASVGSLRIF
jgi:hypothetical protein